MTDRTISLPILLGAAFAVLYWVLDAVATAVPALGGTAFLVVSVAMVLAWALAAAYVLAPDPRRTTDFTEEMIVIALSWTALFGGTAVVLTVTFGAVTSVLWPAAVARTFWFGTILVATVVVGIAAIATGGLYQRL